MTPQVELLSRKFFEIVTQFDKNFKIILELVTRDFLRKYNFRVTNS